MTSTLIWYGKPDPSPAYAVGSSIEARDEVNNLIYSINLGSSLTQKYVPDILVASANGYVYTGMSGGDGIYLGGFFGVYGWCGPNGMQLIRKFRQNGQEIPFPNISVNRTLSQRMKVDSQGALIIGGLQVEEGSNVPSPVSDTYLQKYDSEGVLVWSQHPQKTNFMLYQRVSTILDIIVDSSDNIYSLDAYGEINKYDSDGVIQWTQIVGGIGLYAMYVTAGRFTCLSFDDDGNICAFGYGDSYYPGGDNDFQNNIDTNRVYFDWPFGNPAPNQKSFVRFDSDGNYLDSHAAFNDYSPRDVRQVLWDSSTATWYYSSYPVQVRKFNADLTEQTYVVDPTIPPQLYNTPQVFALHPDGTVLYASGWGAQGFPTYADPEFNYGCVSIARVDGELPTIPWGIAFGIPDFAGDRYTMTPGLGLGISLPTPKMIWDYVGTQAVATRYRLILTDGSSELVLPISSFSCRRSAGKVSLDVVCPAVTSSDVTAITDLSSGDLVLYRGIFIAGSDQLAEMMRVPLSAIRWDAGSKNSSVTLSGNDSVAIEAPKTRRMAGISYRNNQTGIRRVRCAVDTYLSPGDTADLGSGETMLVAEITYTVNPFLATMEIAEARL